MCEGGAIMVPLLGRTAQRLVTERELEKERLNFQGTFVTLMHNF